MKFWLSERNKISSGRIVALSKSGKRRKDLLFGAMRKLVFACMAVAGLFFAESAHAVITLPDTGIDIVGYIGALIVAFALIAAAIVGGNFAFKLVWGGMRAAGRAITGK